MRMAVSCLTGLLVGTWRGVGLSYWVMFGTARHTAALRRSHRSRSDRRHGRCTHTHICAIIIKEPWILNMRTGFLTQIDARTSANRHTHSFQPASHLGDSYFRKEHSIRTNTASSSTLYAPSATPFPLAFLFTALLLFLLSPPSIHLILLTGLVSNFPTFSCFSVLFSSLRVQSCYNRGLLGRRGYC